MRALNLYLLLSLLPLTATAQNISGEIVFKNVTYFTNKTVSQLECRDFTLSNEQIELTQKIKTPIGYQHIREDDIPADIVLGHIGYYPIVDSYVLLTNKAGVIKRLPVAQKLFPNHSNLDPKRAYTISATECDQNKVRFEMWGGGNCSSVCEARGTATFNSFGNVIRYGDK